MNITPRRTTTSLALILLAGAASGCASDSQTQAQKPAKLAEVTPVRTAGAQASPADGYYADAVDAIGRRDYGRALDLLQLAREKSPSDVRVLNAFGVVYDKLGRFDLSARYYAQAQTLDPKSTIVASNVAYSQVLQGGSPREAAPQAIQLATAQTAPSERAQGVTLQPLPIVRLPAYLARPPLTQFAMAEEAPVAQPPPSARAAATVKTAAAAPTAARSPANADWLWLNTIRAALALPAPAAAGAPVPTPPAEAGREAPAQPIPVAVTAPRPVTPVAIARVTPPQVRLAPAPPALTSDGFQAPATPPPPAATVVSTPMPLMVVSPWSSPGRTVRAPANVRVAKDPLGGLFWAPPQPQEPTSPLAVMTAPAPENLQIARAPANMRFARVAPGPVWAPPQPQEPTSPMAVMTAPAFDRAQIARVPTLKVGRDRIAASVDRIAVLAPTPIAPPVLRPLTPPPAKVSTQRPALVAMSPIALTAAAALQAPAMVGPADAAVARSAPAASRQAPAPAKASPGDTAVQPAKAARLTVAEVRQAPAPVAAAARAAPATAAPAMVVAQQVQTRAAVAPPRRALIAPPPAVSVRVSTGHAFSPPQVPFRAMRVRAVALPQAVPARATQVRTVASPTAAPSLQRAAFWASRPPLVVINASGRRDRAEPVRAGLVRVGWSAPVWAVREAPRQAVSVIRYPVSRLQVARALASTLPGPVRLTPCTTPCSGLQLVLGADALTWNTANRWARISRHG